MIDNKLEKNIQIRWVLTQDFLYKFVASDGTVLYDTNKFGEHFIMCGTLIVNPENFADCRYARFRSQPFDLPITKEFVEKLRIAVLAIADKPDLLSPITAAAKEVELEVK
jgi:hypothetical protein